MKVAVVILAGGAGTRIGGDKPARLLGGRTLLAHMMSHARRWSDTVAVSLREPGQVRVPADIPVICDMDGAGPLAGVQAAGQFALSRGKGAVLTVPCDTPFVPGDLLARLSGALDRQAALASSNGRLHPACGLWRSEAFTATSDGVTGSDQSLRTFAEWIGYRAVAWNTAPFDPFLNINRPDDLAEAERRWQIL